MRLLVLRLGSRRLALPAQDVQRILFWAPLQQIPNLPDWLPGFLLLAGELVPVVEVSLLLGWEPIGDDLHNHLVLLQAGEGRYLLKVSRVEGVNEVAPDQLRPLQKAPDDALQGLVAAAWWDGKEAVPVLVPRLLLLREEAERTQHWAEQLKLRLQGLAG